MATPVTDPALLEQLNAGGKKPVADPALLAQLNGEAPKGPSITDAVTDIPREIGATAERNLTAMQDSLSSRGSKGPIEGLMSTGRAIMGGLGLIASPIAGAARSLIGHPMAQATQAVGSVIAPEIAAKQDPKQLYETAAGDAETALMAAKPGVRAPAPVAAPSVAELKAASRAAYRSPEIAAVQINPQSTANLATQIENRLVNQGFRPANEGPVFTVLNELRPPAGVTAVGVNDIDSARKALGIMARERDAAGAATPRAAAASIARDAIGDYLPNIPARDVLAGDAARASEILGEAQANWGAAKRGEGIDLQLTRAERQAAKSGMGGNVENAMRQKIATILDNPKRTAGYSPAEIQAMEDIVRGTRGRNALRAMGKLGVDGGLSLMLNTGAAIGSGGATIPVTAAGTIARMLGQRATARAGTGLSEMVRNRSPLATGQRGQAAVQQAILPPGPSQATSIPYAAIVSALLQQQGTHR